MTEAGTHRDSEKGKIGTLAGLPGLSLDALTSVAYGPEAIVVVLAASGSGAIAAVRPITVAIVVLLAILVFSYRQVISAYPDGGGAYAVSKANLGREPSLLAGASLIVDYVLTVAVSITAGVAALTSAFPTLASATVPLCLAMLVLLTVLNLFGLAESARAFLIPTLVFIGGLYWWSSSASSIPSALPVPDFPPRAPCQQSACCSFSKRSRRDAARSQV